MNTILLAFIASFLFFTACQLFGPSTPVDPPKKSG